MISTEAFQEAVASEQYIAKKRQIRVIVITLVVSVVASIGLGMAFSFGGFMGGIFGGIILYFIMDAVYVSKARDAFEQRIMELMNTHVFEPRFWKTVFDRKHGFEADALKPLGLIEHGNIYQSNDYLKGQYKGVDFERADVLSQQRTQSGKTTVTTTYFKGQVYHFDFHKLVSKFIRIRSKDGMFSGFSKGRRIDGSRKMKFEDSDFNDRFHIASNDEHEAFYVFTPHFMDKVSALDTMVNVPMSLVIKGGGLYLALYTSRDSFETSVFRGIDDAFMTMMRRDVEIISKIIDDLDLDSELFQDIE